MKGSSAGNTRAPANSTQSAARKNESSKASRARRKPSTTIAIPPEIAMIEICKILFSGTSRAAAGTRFPQSTPESPITIHVTPTAIRTQRADGTGDVRIRRCTPTAINKARGGIAGRIYPGSFDCEKLKNKKGNIAQQKIKNPGELLQDLCRQSRSPSSRAGQRHAVQGSSPSRRIGTKYQNGWRC